MSENNDISRMCPVGLLTTEYHDDISNFAVQAEESKHDFIVTPISHPSFKRVLDQDNTQQHAEWKDCPVFDRKDLIIKSAGNWRICLIGMYKQLNCNCRVVKQDHWFIS